MERIEEIYREALALFVERGYDNTPMSLIAKELKLSKAGIYYYFDSKEHLLFQIHKHSLETELIPILEKAENQPDPEKALRLFIGEYTRLLGRDPSPGVLIHEAKRLEPDHYREIRQVWRRAFTFVRNAISELEKAGKCRKSLNKTFAAFAAIGMCSWIYTWYDYSHTEAIDQLADTFVQLFMNGILES